jgi:hypothetical protein
MDIQTNKFYSLHRPAPSLVALYCLSSDSQHNPRPRIAAGHSILANVYQDLAATEISLEQFSKGNKPTGVKCIL